MRDRAISRNLIQTKRSSRVAQVFQRSTATILAVLVVQFHASAQSPEPSVPPINITIPEAPPAAEEGDGRKTLGGFQLFTDELFFRGYRIQRHAIIGHHRLIDPEDRRLTFGSFQTCQDKLEEIKREKGLEPMSGRALVLLHGLGGWRGTMQPVADFVAAAKPYTIVNLNYASTRESLADHARGLASVLSHLDGITDIDIVAHSMGNLVVRRYLRDATENGGTSDPRIRRMVMLAPPNHGATLASDLSSSEIVQLVFGDAVGELGQDWSKVEATLATPTFEFGIIAGGRGTSDGNSGFLAGDDDGLVDVATTQLSGAADFLILPTRHNVMLISPSAQEHTLRFLEHGYFTSADAKHPIP